MPDVLMPGRGAKRERDPAAHPARLQRHARAVQRRRGPASPRDRGARAAAPRAAACSSNERIVWSLDRRLDADRRRSSTGIRRPPSLNVRVGAPSRVERERALRPAQVGHRHRAQLRAVEPIGRKRDRHAQDRAPDAVLAEHGPERLRLSEQPELRVSRAESGSGRCAETRSTVPMCVDDSVGRYVRRSRSRKSKMLCRAGLVPVLNDDQATGETDGKRRPQAAVAARIGQPAEVRELARVPGSARSPADPARRVRR